MRQAICNRGATVRLFPVWGKACWLLSLLIAGEVLADPSRLADPFAACEEQFRAQPDNYDSSYCFFQAARPERRWCQAEVRLEELLTRYPANHWLRLSLGHVHWRLDTSRAEATYRLAADGFRQQENASGEVLVRTNLHSFLLRYGSREQADLEMDRVIEVASTSDDPIVRARALVLEADHLRLRSRELETAHRLLRQAEALLFPDGPYRLQRSCLIGLGSACYRLSRYREARDYQKRLEELARTVGDDNTRALVKFNQANTLLAEMFELPKAGSREHLLAMYREALAVAESADHRSAAVQSHRNLGDLLSRSPETREQARVHYQSCVDLAREMRHRRRLAACLRSLGGHSARWGQSDEASELLQESLGLARETGDHQGAVRFWETKMRSSWAAGSKVHALEDTRLALDAVEELRERQPEASGRAGLFAAWADLYYWPAGRLLEAEGQPIRDDLELAFSFAERLRGRVLLEAVANSRTAVPGADGDVFESVATELVRIQRRLLDASLSDAERRRILRELERVEMREAEVRHRRLPSDISSADPGFEFASLPEVEAALAEDEALFSFQIALWEDVYGDFGGGSWLLVSRRQGTRVYRLPDRVDVRPAVRLFRGLFDARDGSEARAAARLYDDLLSIAIADLPPTVKRLVLVPDGELHLLPFGALRSSVDDRPLALRFKLSRVPSATLWLRWRRAARDGEPTRSEVDRSSPLALAMADPLPPTPGPLDSRVDDSEAKVPTDRDWALASGTRLGALPYARDEGRAVIRHLGAESRLLIGAEATEHFLKSGSVDGFRILHFAAHAVIDSERPQRSAVLLAAGAPGEDGLLQPRDIAELNLNGKLVVLSACQSATGAVLQGEGVLSLARAFFEAGASAVVGSLWRLRDDEAAAFFDRFYSHLADGKSAAGALAAAQKDRIRAGAPAAAWAGLTVLGDGGVVPVPGGTRSDPLRYLGIAAVCCLLLFVLLWQRRASLGRDR